MKVSWEGSLWRPRYGKEDDIKVVRLNLVRSIMSAKVRVR